MTEEKKPTNVVIQTRNTVQMVIAGEKGEYTFSIPLGSPLEEATSAAGYFLSALSKSLKEHQEKLKAAGEKKDEQPNSNEGQAGDSQK